MSERTTRERLIEAAREASSHSYAPYSNFRVGAALLCDDGKIVTGTNVENRSYGLGICAERSAIVSAVTQGYRSFAEIAVFSPDSDYPVTPCGACRQVISEFMASGARVIFVGRDGTIEEHSMSEVLPFDALHELKDR